MPRTNLRRPVEFSSLLNASVDRSRFLCPSPPFFHGAIRPGTVEIERDHASRMLLNIRESLLQDFLGAVFNLADVRRVGRWRNGAEKEKKVEQKRDWKNLHNEKE